MSVPMTILLGVFGSFLGGGIAAAFLGTDQSSGDVFGILSGSILASVVILVLYRRYVQHRPITGPEAQRPPRERPHLGTLFGRSRGRPAAPPPRRLKAAAPADGAARRGRAQRRGVRGQEGRPARPLLAGG